MTQAQARAMAEMGTVASAYPDFDPGEDPWNRSPAFNSHARNKRSMACDVMSPEGREAFFRLIEQCDVLVENNVPMTVERAGITYEQLRERNPRIVVLRMPAYGLDGPYKNYRGFGTPRGGDDRPPLPARVPGPHAGRHRRRLHGRRAGRRERARWRW